MIPRDPGRSSHPCPPAGRFLRPEQAGRLCDHTSTVNPNSSAGPAADDPDCLRPPPGSPAFLPASRLAVVGDSFGFSNNCANRIAFLTSRFRVI
jgi:hypothetical protein